MPGNIQSQFDLDQPVSHLPSVGPAAIVKLNRLGITTCKDLIYYFPFRYQDLSLTTSINSLQAGETVTLKGHFLSLTTTYLKGGKTLQKGVFTDGSGFLNVTWFNQPYLVKTLASDIPVSLSGKIKPFRGHPTLTSPQFEINRSIDNLVNPNFNIHTGRLVPVYHETTGISSKWLRRIISKLLISLKPLPDWLPPEFLHVYQLINLDTALRQIHFPDNQETLNRSINRLKFDELLELQLAAQQRHEILLTQPGYLFKFTPKQKQDFILALPFKLTTSQFQALQDLETDFLSGHPMNRLLQGDVGSGKTIVAAYALYLSAINHFPAVFMAPTEILAHQHLQTLTPIFDRLHFPISLHTSSHRTPVNPANLIHLGTHSLLQLRFAKPLGVVIVDEQHKFGVNQRTKLSQAQDLAPHFLSMTATPIPRTLSLTLSTDLKLSNLTESPHPHLIKTRIVKNPDRAKAYDFIARRILEFHDQVFYICPFIEDSLNPDFDSVKAAQSVFTHLKDDIFPKFKLGLIHGRLKSAEKDRIIDAFRLHQLDLLVSTPIVEVGVDIPDASIMCIESAERFGLASLHQLRGRVGRQGQTAFCLVFPGPNLSPKGLQRLEALETSVSGFELAEIDLKLRGPGDLYGTAQSGFFNLKLASLSDLNLIKTTHQAAQSLLKWSPSFLPLSLKLRTLLKYPVYGRTS